MTPAEAAALLTIAAAYDRRKPDADAAKAWAMALDGLRFEDCRAVIVAHYQRTNDWLMPNHVITEVRKLREKRLHRAGDPTPPPDLTPLETIAWLRDARRRIADGETVTVDYGELMSEHTAENDAGLTDTEVDQINDGFVEANRAEFLDTDFDLPIQRAIESLVVERMRVAWHEGYGAGSSNATDGWLDHRSPVTRNPYTRVIPPEETGEDA